MKTIIASSVRTNSQNNLWAVSISGERQPRAHCKSAYKAMRFMFILKNKTGLNISDNCLCRLSHEIASQKTNNDTTAADAAEVSSQKRYADLKKQHADALFILRDGDSYRFYEEDVAAARIVLGDYPVSFPQSELDVVLPRLIRAGKRVAIVD